MIVIKVIFVWLLWIITKTTDRFGVKNVSALSAAVILILFGDTLIPAVFHILHLMWEVFESIIEHFLESAFHLTPRQAEVIVAWIGILTMISVGIKLAFSAFRYSVILYGKLQRYFDSLKANLSADPVKLGLALSVLSLSTYGASFLLF